MSEASHTTRDEDRAERIALSTTTLAIAQATSEEGLLESLTLQLLNLVPQVHRVSIILRAEDGAATLRTLPSSSVDAEPFTLEGTMAARVIAAAGGTVWSPEANSELRDSAQLWERGFRRVASAPIPAGEGAHGTVNVASRDDAPWADAETLLLAQLGALAGACLDRLRLVDQLRELATTQQRHALRLEVIGDVGHRLSSATSAAGVLGLAERAVRCLVGAGRVTYATRCADGEHAVETPLEAGDGRTPALGTVVETAGSAIGSVLASGEPVVVECLAESPFAEHTALARAGLLRAVHAPIRDAGVAVGILNVAWSDRRMTGAEMVIPLIALARLVGTTLGRLDAQEQAAGVLREEQARIRQVVDLVPHAIVARDQEGRFVLVNRAAAGILGVDRAQMEGRRAQDLGVHDDEALRTEEEDRRVLVDGHPIVDQDDTVTTADGRVLNVTTTKIPFTLAGTSEPAVLSVQVDVTERLEFERHLAASEARARALIDDAPLLLVALDGDARVIRVSRFGATQLGYEQDEVVGTHFAYLHPEEERTQVRARIHGLLAQGGGVRVDECRMVRRDGTEIWARQTARVATDAGRDAAILLVCEDITEVRQLGERLAHQASHDSLTGIVNRREFDRRLAEVVARCHGGGTAACLCFIDIDHFKIINDTCGHRAGDQFLREIVRPLRRVMRGTDTLARIGGDEFGLILEGCTEREGRKVAERLRQSIEDFEFHWEGRRFGVSLSIGLVPIDGAEHDAALAMTSADTACYAAKDLGRNRVEVAAVGASVGTRRGAAEWVARTRAALAEDRLVLFAQPIVPVGGADDLLRFEVLVRMIDTDGELIPPAAFIPAAERFGLIDQIDQWVIDRVLARLEDDAAMRERIGLCTINVSVRSLESEQFLTRLVSALRGSRIPGRILGFEITETAAVSRIEPARRFVETLSGFGCRFGLDDFGSGFSSFSHLKGFGVDFLKIDGSLIRDIVNDPTDRAVVQAIHNLARAMGMQTIAEFVESATTMSALEEIGVDFAQGFGVGRPVPFEDLLTETEEMSWLTDALAAEEPWAG